MYVSCMYWPAVAGSIKSLVGMYEFVPVGMYVSSYTYMYMACCIHIYVHTHIHAGPSQTKVIYKLNVDPGFWLPEAIRTATQKAVAGAALNELKKCVSVYVCVCARAYVYISHVRLLAGAALTD